MATLIIPKWQNATLECYHVKRWNNVFLNFTVVSGLYTCVSVNSDKTNHGGLKIAAV